MMDSLLTEALINSKYRVLGKKLRPYCLWHEFLLLASENPFFVESSEEEANIAHLEAAARICCCKYGELPSQKINSKWVAVKAVILGVEKQLASFKTYIDDYNSGPQIWHEEKKEEGGSKSGPPGTIFTAVSCLSLGIDERRVWEMPIGIALWYSATRQFDKGGEMDFVTERNRNIMENLKKQLAEAKTNEET